MSKLISTSDVVSWLKANDNFLILTHVRPDGDTLGSAAGLVQGLREAGKTAFALKNPEATLRYLQFIEPYHAPDGFKPDHIIAVDTATVGLLQKNTEKYKDSVILCIDHHKSNTLYSETICLNPDNAACGEIIYDILLKISGKISAITAKSLYVALSTDTGCFSFSNTTANTLFVASRLVEAGAPNKELNKELFRTKTHGRISIEGKITSGLEYYFDDKVAIASITREMMEVSGADEDDLDDIAALPGSIEGVCVGITIREMSSTHDCKFSVRTRAPYDAQEICAHFGGGGHKLAAGCSVEQTIPEAKSAMLEVLKGIFSK